MLLTALLAYGHVLSAVAWLGGDLFFGSLFASKLGRLSPETSRDFFLLFVPGVSRFFQVVSGTTIVFGLLLLYNMTHGDLSQLGFSTGWGAEITLGMATALVAFVLGEVLMVPAASKVVALQRKSPATGAPPSPEFRRTLRTLSLGGGLSMALLLVTLAFMVGAGYY